MTLSWSGCRAVSLPALLGAGSALRCAQARQGFGPSCGTGCQGRRARLSALLWAIWPCCMLGKAGSSEAEAPRPCLAVSWQGHGVLMPVLHSHTALVKWIEKSLLMLQFRGVLPLWAFALVFYSVKDQRISNSLFPFVPNPAPVVPVVLSAPQAADYCVPGKVNASLGEGQGKGNLALILWENKRSSVSRNPVKPLTLSSTGWGDAIALGRCNSLSLGKETEALLRSFWGRREWFLLSSSPWISGLEFSKPLKDSV